MTKILVDEIQAPGGKPFKVSKDGGVLGGAGGAGVAEIVEVTTLPDRFTAGSVGDQVLFNSDIYRYMGEDAYGHIWKGITTNYASQTGPMGEEVFNVNGTFTVPFGVWEISCVVVGAGGSGYYAWAYSAGGGGALGWANNIPVTPGDSISVVVAPSVTGTNSGSYSQFGNFVKANGGVNGASSNNMANYDILDSTLTDSGGGKGGHTRGSYGGGGGAGGYTGDGGTGGYSSDQTDGSGGGGGGGGGYSSSTYAFGGGGGVSLWGQGTPGVKGDYNNGNSFYGDTDGRYAGKGGSGGMDGGNNSNNWHTRSHTWGDGTTSNYTIYHGDGGMYGGGGGGGGTSVSSNGNFCGGGQGGVRVMWGTGRSFPYNAEYVTPVA